MIVGNTESCNIVTFMNFSIITFNDILYLL